MLTIAIIMMLLQTSAGYSPAQTVSVRLVRTIELTKQLQSPTVAVSPDGKWLATFEATWGTRDWQTTFHLWDVTTGKVRSTISDPNNGRVPSVFLSTDCLAATYTKQDAPGKYTNGTVILSIPELKPLDRYPHRRVLSLSPDGATALCHIFDPKKAPVYELWDWKTNKTVCELPIGVDHRILYSSFRPDGKQLALLIQAPKGRITHTTVRIFNTVTGKQDVEIEGVEWCIAISPDGKSVAVAGDAHNTFRPTNPNRIGFWDRRTESITITKTTHPHFRQGLMHGLHYLPDGRYLIVVSSLGLLVWDLQESKLYEPEEGDKIPLGLDPAVSFAPATDGVYVATMTKKGTIRVWKVSAPEKKQ